MDNKRRVIRLEASDFLQIKPLDEVGKVHEAAIKNFSFMGVCFCSAIEWKNGQVLEINYFLPEENQPVRMKLLVVWSEFISSRQGYFCGGQITDIEPEGQAQFAHYYYRKLQDRFPE